MSNRKFVDGSKLDMPLLLRFLGAATQFNVRGFTVEGWNDGWSVSLGAWVYASDGLRRWRRSPATRWHAAECRIGDLGRAFTLAALIADRDKAGHDFDAEVPHAR